MMKQIDKFCCCIFSLFLMMACQEEEIMDKTAGFQVSLQDMGDEKYASGIGKATSGSV